MYGIPQVAQMMALGLYVFGLHTTPYQQFQRTVSWRHPTNSRVGKPPASQFVGKGEEPITLSGVLYPEITGGVISLAALEEMGDQGKAWPLIEGTGRYYGLFIIEEMSETKTEFFNDGAARKIEFSLKLSRTDDNPSLLGALTKTLLNKLIQV